MHIDLDVEPSRPVPDREAERPREPERRGHRREYDLREPRREFSNRVDGVVRDVAAFRTVALTDLITQQFDGHSYVARHGIAEAERPGGSNGTKPRVRRAEALPSSWRRRPAWTGRRSCGRGPVGRTSADGAARSRRRTWDTSARSIAWHARRRSGSRRRVGASNESGSMPNSRGVAAHAERARQAEGRGAAEAERCRAAAALDLPIEQGKVLFPDAQIEYVNAAGRAGRCNVEVVSQHYASDTIRSKAAAGFQMYAVGSRAADFVRRALASGGGDRGRRGGRGGSREIEVFEI